MRHIPNILTIFRILFTPLIGVFLARHEPAHAFPLLFFAGFSDGVDGYLARRFAWQSKLGAILDPIADKLLLATLFLGFGFGGVLPLWMVGLVLGRDILILSFAVFARLVKNIRAFPPTRWGKYSTFCQLSLAGLCVIREAWPGALILILLPFFYWATPVATVWSGIHYAWTAWRMILKADH